MKKTLRANLFLLIFLFAYILLSTGITLAVQSFMPEYVNIVASALIYLLVFGGAVAVFFFTSKEKISDSLGLSFFSPLSALLTFLIPLLLIPTMLLVTYASGFFLQSSTAGDLLASFTANKVPLWLALILLAGLPAFFEEFIFRGIVLRAYRQYPLWIGVLFSSLAFALFHQTLDQLAYSFVAGAVFALVATWTESLLPAIWGHLVLNAFSIIVAYLPNTWTDAINAFVYRSANSPWFVFGACAVLTLPLLILLLLALKKDCQKTKARRIARYGKRAQDDLSSSKFPGFGEMWPMYVFFLVTVSFIILPFFADLFI